MTWKLSDGDWCHVEIPARDVGRLRTFYGDVFGWKFFEFPGWDGVGVQTSADGIESSIGTLGQEGAEQKVVAFVLVKGTIEDMRRRADQVEAAGGSVVKPPTEIPNVGNFAYVADPEGTVFGLWQDAPSGEPERELPPDHDHPEQT